MTVRELIVELQKQDQDATVLSGDNDEWYYDIGEVDMRRVRDGREVDDVGTEFCVVLISE